MEAYLLYFACGCFGVHKLKLSGLERQTKWLNEQEEKRSSESKVSS